jgi:hypothetical protein
MSRAIQDATACQEALARLPELDLGELRQRWRALYKADASPHLSRELLYELSHTGCRKPLSAASARSGSASFAMLRSSSTKPQRSGGVLVSN